MKGAALSTMVGWMTFGKKKYDHLDSTMRKLIPPIREVMVDLIPLVDADTNAFNMYMVRTAAIDYGIQENLIIDAKYQIRDFKWELFNVTTR